jgi:hypothetical protein
MSVYWHDATGYYLACTRAGSDTQRSSDSLPATTGGCRSIPGSFCD